MIQERLIGIGAGSSDRRQRVLWRTVLGVGLILLLRAQVGYAADAGYAPLATVLETYRDARYDEAIASLTHFTNYHALERGFENAAPKWIAADTPTDRRGRSRVAAVAALEIARLGFIGEQLSPQQFEDAMAALRFGRTLVRDDAEVERLWLLASVALIQGAQNAFLAATAKQPFLDEYWRYAQGRFPEEGRFQLARLLMRPEARRMPNRSGTSAHSMTNGTQDAWLPPDVVPRAELVKDAVAAYDKLLAYPDIAPEVHLRRGILLFHREDLPGALSDLQTAVASSRDPYVVYVGHIYIGMALDARGQAPGAMAAYDAALRLMPRTRSAALLLAEDLVAAGRHADAAALLQETFHAPSATDPWTQFSACDYRFWAEDLRQLREMIQHREEIQR